MRWLGITAHWRGQEYFLYLQKLTQCNLPWLYLTCCLHETSHSSLLHIDLHMGGRCPQLGECGQTLASRTVLVLAVVDDSDCEINMIDTVTLIRHTVVIKLNIH